MKKTMNKTGLLLLALALAACSGEGEKTTQHASAPAAASTPAASASAPAASVPAVAASAPAAASCPPEMPAEIAGILQPYLPQVGRSCADVKLRYGLDEEPSEEYPQATHFILVGHIETDNPGRDIVKKLFGDRDIGLIGDGDVSDAGSFVEGSSECLFSYLPEGVDTMDEKVELKADVKREYRVVFTCSAKTSQ